MTFYRRIDSGIWIQCRAATLVGAKREAASAYLHCLQSATLFVAGEDKVALSSRQGYFSKWVNVKEKLNERQQEAGMGSSD